MGKLLAIRRVFFSEWKSAHFVSVKFRKSLLALNQIDIFCSSRFISLNSLLISLLDKNKFVWSATMTGFKIEEALWEIRKWEIVIALK